MVHVDVCRILQRKIWEGEVTWGLLFLEIWETINTTRDKQKDVITVTMWRVRKLGNNQHSSSFSTCTTTEHSITGEGAIPFTRTLLQAAHKLTSSGDVSELRNREDRCLYIPQIHCWKKSEGVMWTRQGKPDYFPEQTGFYMCFCHTTPTWLSWNLSKSHFYFTHFLCPAKTLASDLHVR